MKLSDKLRKITNVAKRDNIIVNRENHDLLKQSINFITKFEPHVFDSIPHDFENDLLTVARDGKYKYTYDYNCDYFIFRKMYTNPNKEMVSEFLTLFHKAQDNPLFETNIEFDDGNTSNFFRCEYHNNTCVCESLFKKNKLLMIRVHIKFGIRNQIKLLKKQGFRVRVNPINETITVKW